MRSRCFNILEMFSSWKHWSKFLYNLSVESYLSVNNNPLTPLKIYTLQYRYICLPHQKGQFQSHTVEENLWYIVQNISSSGGSDPQCNEQG